MTLCISHHLLSPLLQLFPTEATPVYVPYCTSEKRDLLTCCVNIVYCGLQMCVYVVLGVWEEGELRDGMGNTSCGRRHSIYSHTCKKEDRTSFPYP